MLRKVSTAAGGDRLPTILRALIKCLTTHEFQRSGTDSVPRRLAMHKILTAHPLAHLVGSLLCAHNRQQRAMGFLVQFGEKGICTEVGVPVERNLTAGTVDAMFGVRGRDQLLQPASFYYRDSNNGKSFSLHELN